MKQRDVLAALPSPPPPERGVFCNRTLNLRRIRAIGYDMDYTLVHYHVVEWERRAYAHVRQKLADRGWPVDDLRFDPNLVIRGLVIDRALGNIVKSNRFGYVKRAYHGLAPLAFDAQREAYVRTAVDLTEDRWIFLNTLFSLSEGCLYAQLVQKLDAGEIPGVHGYADLYAQVKAHLDEAHMEGQLKAEIMADPARFVDLDPDAPRALHDQKRAGKTLLLITNSEWAYTRDIMAYAFDPFLPAGTTWRDLFDLVIVSARKPRFFASRAPIFRLEDEQGLLRPVTGAIPGPGIYLGGNAGLVEAFLGYGGAEILYVGDHAYGDVHQSKSIRRWRTALVLRELEDEIAALAAFAPVQETLTERMAEKDTLEYQAAQLRMALRRDRLEEPRAGARAEKKKSNRGAGAKAGGKSAEKRAGAKDGASPVPSRADLQAAYEALRARIAELDERIAPLARQAATLTNERWGLLTRTGRDKSLMARHVERHADIYTSRVANLRHVTPYGYLGSPQGSLPHDPPPPPRATPYPDPE